MILPGLGLVLVSCLTALNEMNSCQRAIHLFKKNPVHGRKSLMIGAHARFIIGWPKDQSRAMLDDLLARATIPENIFVHKWRLGDVIVWDNRAILHRATPFNVNKYRRLMQRTTVSNPDAEAHDLAFTEISRSITK